jgi:hypothetical protein
MQTDADQGPRSRAPATNERDWQSSNPEPASLVKQYEPPRATATQRGARGISDKGFPHGMSTTQAKTINLISRPSSRLDASANNGVRFDGRRSIDGLFMSACGHLSDLPRCPAYDRVPTHDPNSPPKTNENCYQVMGSDPVGAARVARSANLHQ